VERALHTLRKVRNAFAHTTAVAFLVALLEAGTTPWRREWDAAGHEDSNLPPAPNGAAGAADLGEQIAAMFTEHAVKLGGGKP
jgi:antirestriction protein ArdC